MLRKKISLLLFVIIIINLFFLILMIRSIIYFCLNWINRITNVIKMIMYILIYCNEVKNDKYAGIFSVNNIKNLTEYKRR